MPKPRKPKLTKNQRLYQKEISLLERRAKEWEKKFHAKFTDIPATPERITKQDIERVKAIRWKNFTEQQKQQMREEYHWRYEQKDESEAQDDFENGADSDEEPVDSKAEIDKWIEDTIYDIAYGGQIDNETPGVAETLYGLLQGARNRMGDDDFYNFLEQHAGELNTAATNARSGSPGRNRSERYGSYTGMSRDQQNELDRFAQILNLGHDLTTEQSTTLHTEGYVNFDYDEWL